LKVNLKIEQSNKLHLDCFLPSVFMRGFFYYLEWGHLFGSHKAFPTEKVGRDKPVQWFQSQTSS